MKTKSSRSSHPLVAFIILAIIAGLISADIFFYFKAHKKNITTTLPTVTTSKNWKTYTDSGLGFQIDYPADEQIESYFKDNIFYTVIGTMPYEPAPGLFTIGMKKNTTADEYLAEAQKDTSSCSKSEIVTLNSRDAIFYTCVSEFAGDTIDNFVIARNNNIYHLSFMLVPQGTTAKNVKFVISPNDQKMLDSFRITERLTDWQLYTNSDYGFSLQYPQDWKQENFKGGISGCCFTGSGVVAIDSIKQRPGGHEGEGEALRIYLKDITPTQYATKYNTFNRVGLKDADFVEKKQTETLSGIEVTHLRLGTPMGSYFEVIFFKQGVLKPFYIEYDDNDPLHQQILSTFRLTEDMSGWQTYTNEKYGFNFQYPSNWKQIDSPTFLLNLSENDPYSYDFSGVFIKTTNPTTIEDALAKAIKEYKTKLDADPDYPSSYPKYTEPKVVDFHGQTAIQRSYRTYEITPPGTEYILPEKGLIITISDLYGNGKVSVETMSTLRNQILSTFKFTK